MTQYPECYLARELQICYVNISLITDYDVGLPGTRTRLARDVMKIFASNNERVKQAIFRIIEVDPRGADLQVRLGARPARGNALAVRQSSVDLSIYLKAVVVVLRNPAIIAGPLVASSIAAVLGLMIPTMATGPLGGLNGGLAQLLVQLLFSVGLAFGIIAGGPRDTARPRILGRNVVGGRAAHWGPFDGCARPQLRSLGRGDRRRVPDSDRRTDRGTS